MFLFPRGGGKTASCVPVHRHHRRHGCSEPAAQVRGAWQGEGSNEPCQSKRLINIIGAVNLSPSLCLGLKQLRHEMLAVSLDVF